MRFAFGFLAFILLGCAGQSGSNTPKTCSLPDETTDAGAVAPLFVQRCDVPGSMGMRKWYRIAGTLPGTTHVVQVELYDNAGPFVGGAVRAGTFPVDTDPVTCGVCVRAVGDKGGSTELEYFATGGTVTITEVGAPGSDLGVEISDLALEQIDADRVLVDDGCTATVSGAGLDGTLVHIGGMGGGGGGGGGACATTVGDATRPQ
jgi:hypothetical protein